MNHLTALLLGLGVDLLLGDPRWLPHPVQGIGWLIGKLEAALRRAGATFLDGAADPPADRTPITKADLFCLGLSGGKDSQLRRREMLRWLDLPEHMGANALLSVLNALYSREEFLREADAWR